MRKCLESLSCKRGKEASGGRIRPTRLFKRVGPKRMRKTSWQEPGGKSDRGKYGAQEFRGEGRRVFRRKKAVSLIAHVK